MCTNDVAVQPGRGVYSLMCNENGGVIDDVFVFRLEPTRFFIVSNASREQADLAWLRTHSRPDATLEVRTARGALAIQGAAAPAILVRVAPEAAQVGRNRIAQVSIAGRDSLVSGTGYTGEDGLRCLHETISLPSGRPSGPRASLVASLGRTRREGHPPARDVLPYGHELNENISPYEAGYGWV